MWQNVLKKGTEFKVVNKTKNLEYVGIFDASQRERDILKIGGYLNFAKKRRLGI